MSMLGDDFLGVFVRPVYPQNEGLNRVFDNLSSMGVTAICTTPTVSRPVEGSGGCASGMGAAGIESGDLSFIRDGSEFV